MAKRTAPHAATATAIDNLPNAELGNNLKGLSWSYRGERLLAWTKTGKLTLHLLRLFVAFLASTCRCAITAKARQQNFVLLKSEAPRDEFLKVNPTDIDVKYLQATDT